MASWPTLPEVRTLLRLQPDVNEDAVLRTAVDGAIDFGIRRLGGTQVLQPDGVTLLWVFTYPVNTTTLPDAAHEAALLHAARLYRRRDSIDGTISWGDVGVRVGRVDPDVMGLYDSIGPWGFA
jgi:hypothetical protein